MKRRSVVVAPKALDDLDRIQEWVREGSSALIARRYTARIRRYLRSLGTASQRGNEHSDWHVGLRSIGFEGRVQIVFEVEENQVVVTRIFYGGQDWRAAIRPDD